MNTKHVINQRVQELIDKYSAADASVAGLVCDRHPADALAYTVVEPDLSARALTYGELGNLSRRFAAGLATVGVSRGDRVATLMSKSVDYLVTLLGIWRLGAVHVPLFTAFAPPAIATRLLGSGTKLVVCDSAQRSKLDASADLPDVPPWRIVLSGDAPRNGDLAFNELLAAESLGLSTAAVGGEAPMIHIYTSGTTGAPKAVIVPVKALASFQAYAEFGLDLESSDTYWCAADPGWAYGLYFGVLGSFTTGVPSILLRAGFSPDLTWSVMHKYRVTNFAAAPTVYRSLRASGPPPVNISLRCASSAGEPLTPEINEWAMTALGTSVHDHYGQTEAGMFINNHHQPALARPLRPGSMGHPMPGWTVNVLHQDRDEIAPVGVTGRIAADLLESPLAWFEGYDRNADKTAEKFSVDGRWYLTGDAGAIDTDGYVHFSARDDDVIIMAGYRIGPFEVESVLAQHPNVIESAVIGAPDELRGEILEAYVVLGDAAVDMAAQEHDLQQLVKTKFAAHAYPRRIHFVDELPKTPSGKVQRFVLREQRRREIDTVKGPILVGQHGDTRWLRLNRPEKRNALGPDLVSAFDAALGDAMDDAATRFVVISGEGPSFCAGADLKHLRALASNGTDPVPYLDSISACFDRIEKASKPVIALVHGHAVAGGLELALVCDVVVATSGTLIGDGHARNGLLPAAGSSVRLPRKVGDPLARWLILTGQLLPAEAFVPSGFVHAVVERSEAEDVIDGILAELRAPIPSTQSLGKYLLLQSGQLMTTAGPFVNERNAFARNWANGHIPSTLQRFAES